MKNDYFNTLEERDLLIREDLEMDIDRQALNAVIETYFDVDKKFGINTLNDESAWVNLYADYNPVTKDLNVVYYIDVDADSYERQYIPTDEEKQIFINVMEQARAYKYEMSCRAFYISEYFMEADKIRLVCEQNGNNYQIRNTEDDFIIYAEDDKGTLKNHVGHEIEIVEYGDGVCVSIECMGCHEVLYSTDNDEFIVQETPSREQKSINQESRMSELLSKAIEYIGEYECANGLYDTLHNRLGMTNDEIKTMGYGSLSEFFADKQEDGMTMNQ